MVRQVLIEVQLICQSWNFNNFQLYRQSELKSDNSIWCKSLITNKKDSTSTNSVKFAAWRSPHRQSIFLTLQSSATTAGISISKLPLPKYHTKLEAKFYPLSKENILSMSVLPSTLSNLNIVNNSKNGYSKNTPLLPLILRNVLLRAVTMYSQCKNASGEQL